MNRNKKFRFSAFQRIKKHQNRFTDGRERAGSKSKKNLPGHVKDHVHFFSQNRRHPVKFSFWCHFFVSRWILLRVGDLKSLVEFFWFLFLVFQCYRTVASPLQSLIVCIVFRIFTQKALRATLLRGFFLVIICW